MEPSSIEPNEGKPKSSGAKWAALALVVVLSVGLGSYFFTLEQTPNPPKPQVLSYQSIPTSDQYVIYVSISNEGGDGWVEVDCKVVCGPCGPIEEREETTSDGTRITYENFGITTYGISISENGSSTMQEIEPELEGWITLRKGYSLNMRSGETTVAQIMLCSPPTTVFHTDVYARAKVTE